MKTFNDSILIAAVFSVLLSGGNLLAQSGSRKAQPTRQQPAARQQQIPRQTQKPGIVGKKAADWKVSEWYQLPDNKESLNVDDYEGKFLYLYFFQSWCPGCHKVGFPTLQKVSRAFEGDDNVAFVAIQTTFEGHSVNTADKLEEIAKRYKLKIPFGQSAGSSGTPDIMRKYRTGGTPWTVIIDPNGQVVFNDYRIDASKAIAGLRKGSEQHAKKMKMAKRS